MNHTKKRLNSVDIQKIKARYLTKLEEFKLLSLDELQSLYQTKKLSSTDKNALIAATDYLLKQKVAEKAKEIKETENIDGE